RYVKRDATGQFDTASSDVASVLQSGTGGVHFRHESIDISVEGQIRTDRHRERGLRGFGIPGNVRVARTVHRDSLAGIVAATSDVAGIVQPGPASVDFRHERISA